MIQNILDRKGVEVITIGAADTVRSAADRMREHGIAALVVKSGDAIKGLVRETEVHRDVYIDEEVFQLEMEHVFTNTWAYVGHDSQIPNPGDYYGTTIGTQPILMVRHTDGTV